MSPSLAVLFQRSVFTCTHTLKSSGFYMLPVSCLIEPPDELLVGKTSQGFIEGLKAEMMDNPTADVQPILALVHLKTGDVFDPKLKDGYVYETVGGNHSRQALQEFLSWQGRKCIHIGSAPYIQGCQLSLLFEWHQSIIEQSHSPMI